MIENIIFDFGGVLLNLDYDRSFDAIASIMEEDSSVLMTEMEQVFHDFEKGNISEETFIWNIQNRCSDIPQPKQIIDAWNAMLLGWNPERFKMLETLAEDYNLYILSNTNSIHISWVHDDLAKNHGIHDFEERFFKKVYYSHDIHRRKPDAEIYRYITTDAAINPRTSLFIDDNKDNILSARQCELNAQLHDPSNDIVDMIEVYLKKFNT